MDRYLLCIDGGAERGLIPSLILAELQRRVEARVGGPAELWRGFDLIAGSGSGGLIAAGLTAPIAPGAEAAAMSPGMLAEVFRRDLPRALSRGLFGGGRPDDGRRLEGLLDEVLPPARLDAGLTRVMMTAACLKDHAPVRLTSPATYDWTDEDWFFRQAVRATMAAPGLVEPTAIQNARRRGERRMLVGGETWAADPTMAAVAEAFERDWGHDRIFVLSLGTGRPGSAKAAARELGAARGVHAFTARVSAQAASAQADILLNRGGALQHCRIDGALEGRSRRKLEATARAWIAEHDKVLTGWAVRIAARLGVPIERPVQAGSETVRLAA